MNVATNAAALAETITEFSTPQLILGAIAIVLSIIIMVVIMVQQGKNDGLGAMGGNSGDADSFFNKNQKRTRDAILSKVTIAVSILLVIVIVVMNLVMK